MPENWFGFCLSLLPSFPSPSLEETNSQLTNNVGAVRVHQRRWWVLRSPRPRAVWFLQMLELSSSSSRSCLLHPGAVCLPHPPAPSGLPRRRPAAPRAAGSSLGAELWKERRPRNTTRFDPARAAASSQQGAQLGARHRKLRIPGIGCPGEIEDDRPRGTDVASGTFSRLPR